MAKEKTIKQLLDEQPKVRVRIPEDKASKINDSVPVSINGYIFQVKRGVTVEVPEEVARLLEEAKYI